MWDLSVQDRLSYWRKFRQGLDKLSFHDCLHQVNKFYWTAPLSNSFFSPDLPRDWPDPWELNKENYYDDIARALGMLYTIALTRHSDHKIEIKCYRDRSASQDYNLVWIDEGLYVLNYDLEVRVNNQLRLEQASLIYTASKESLLGINIHEQYSSN